MTDPFNITYTLLRGINLILKGFSMRTNMAFLAALAIAGPPVSAASAATVSDHFDITEAGSAFTSIPYPATGPALTSPVTLSFDITFDPTISYADETTTGISNFTSSLAIDSPVSFSYDAATHFLTVGGTSDGTGYVQQNTNDFYLHIENFTTTPDVQQVGFTTTAGYYYFIPATSPVVISPVPPTTPVSAVPLPASLPLLGGALVGLALFGVKRRQAARSDAAI